MDKDINSLSEDPHHTIPSPPGLNSHAQYDAYADNAMGTGPAAIKLVGISLVIRAGVRMVLG